MRYFFTLWRTALVGTFYSVSCVSKAFSPPTTQRLAGFDERGYVREMQRSAEIYCLDGWGSPSMDDRPFLAGESLHRLR